MAHTEQMPWQTPPDESFFVSPEAVTGVIPRIEDGPTPPSQQLVKRVVPDAVTRVPMLVHFDAVTGQEVGAPVPYRPAPPTAPTATFQLTHDPEKGYQIQAATLDPVMADAFVAHAASLVRIHAVQTGQPLPGFEPTGFARFDEAYKYDVYDEAKPAPEHQRAFCRQATSAETTTEPVSSQRASEPEKRPSLLGEFMAGRLGAVVKIGLVAVLIADGGDLVAKNAAANFHDNATRLIHLHSPQLEWNMNWKPWAVLDDLGKVL